MNFHGWENRRIQITLFVNDMDVKLHLKFLPPYLVNPCNKIIGGFVVTVLLSFTNLVKINRHLKSDLTYYISKILNNFDN